MLLLLLVLLCCFVKIFHLSGNLKGLRVEALSDLSQIKSFFERIDEVGGAAHNTEHNT
jgi:hypothetical protein